MSDSEIQLNDAQTLYRRGEGSHWPPDRERGGPGGRASSPPMLEPAAVAKPAEHTSVTARAARRRKRVRVKAIGAEGA